VPRHPFGSVLRRRARDGSLLRRFYVRWRDADGRAHLRAAGTTRASAEALLDALRGEVRLARGLKTPPDSGRRKEAASLALATLTPEVLKVWRSSLAPGSLRDRRGALARWALRLGSRPLSDLTRADIEEAVRTLLAGRPGTKGLAASTVRTEVGILSSAFETLRRALRVPLPVNPCRGVRLPSLHARARPHLPPGALDRLLAACPSEHRGPLTVMADTGLRPAELFRLTFAEVDLELDSLRLTRTKTYQTRTLPLTARARAILLEARQARPDAGPDQLVFPVSEKGLRRGFREAAKAAGLPNLVPYTLRHAYASTLILEGAPPSVVRDLLGHANIKTTDIYLRSLPGDAARAAVNALERARVAPGAPVVPAEHGPHEAARTGGLAAPGPA